MIPVYTMIFLQLTRPSFRLKKNKRVLRLARNTGVTSADQTKDRYSRTNQQNTPHKKNPRTRTGRQTGKTGRQAAATASLSALSSWRCNSRGCLRKPLMQHMSQRTYCCPTMPQTPVAIPPRETQRTSKAYSLNTKQNEVINPLSVLLDPLSIKHK